MMILAGCLCLAMIFSHSFSSYKNALDKSTIEFYTLSVNQFLIWMTLNAVVIMIFCALHRLFKRPMHYVVRYIFRCLSISIVLNIALHIDMVVMENTQPNGLWTLYSWGESLMTIFMFFSVLIARKWSEVFNWLQTAHSR
jgi:hypothetical protein